MFSFFKPKAPPLLQTDMHLHLLPSLDDGSRSLEESMQMLEALERLGYRRLILTPHHSPICYGYEREVIIEHFEAFSHYLKHKKVKMALKLGAEYYMDEYFLKHLEQAPLLGVNGYILIETSRWMKPLFFNEVIFKLQAQGYRPILAHPERYRYLCEPKQFEALKQMGILLQIDLLSFEGYYGKEAQKKAHCLAKRGWIDFLGSDLHRPHQLPLLEKIPSRRYYRKIFELNRILNEELF